MNFSTHLRTVARNYLKKARSFHKDLDQESEVEFALEFLTEDVIALLKEETFIDSQLEEHPDQFDPKEEGES